jgi:hypothetical protein
MNLAGKDCHTENTCTLVDLLQSQKTDDIRAAPVNLLNLCPLPLPPKKIKLKRLRSMWEVGNYLLVNLPVLFYVIKFS